MSRRRPCVKHFSHSHPLRPIDVKEEEELICSGCELDLSGSAYSCSKSTCEFFLHGTCFDLPKRLQFPPDHVSHHQHPLVLLPSPPAINGQEYPKFACNACGDYGTGFTYSSESSSESFNLHVTCALLPDVIKHVDHDHPLRLFCPSTTVEKSNSIFTCDVCRKHVPENCWIYYCLECDYGTDLACTSTT
ncbi:hypothetical protein LINGRAHAP2_LOCUS12102 [Linum grandiflorum]